MFVDICSSVIQYFTFNFTVWMKHAHMLVPFFSKWKQPLELVSPKSLQHLPQLWNQNFTKDIDADKVTSILIYNDKAKAKVKQSHLTTPRDPIHLDFFDEFLNEINGTSPHTVPLSLFCDHQENFVTKNTGKEARPH